MLAADVVGALFKADDARAVLVEGQSPRRQPHRELLLDLSGLFLADAQSHQIVGITDHHGGARLQPTGVPHPIREVPAPGGFMQPMQGDVQHRRADKPALWSPRLGRGELFTLDHARLQPLLDLFPRGMCRADGEDALVDAVEHPCQIRVETPPAVRVLAPDRSEDRLDGVMAATVGPKAVRLRLEPCLRLGCRRVEGVELHGDNGLTDIDRIAAHCTGKPCPDRFRARGSARAGGCPLHGWGAL
nr:hypothetical protein [Streptomyces tailanensis]